MHLPKSRLLATLGLLALPSMAVAQAPPPDGLDTAWNGSGTALMAVSGHNVGSIGGVALVVQPDGRLLLAGGCGIASGATTVCMARLQPNGLRDYGFGPAGTGAFAFSQFPSYPATAFVRGLVRQGDGRILVAGASASDLPDDDPTQYASVTRLRADGTLDPSTPAQPLRFEFAHADANPASLLTSAALQPDGKLVTAGLAYRDDGASANIDFGVARLRADLTLDPSFHGSQNPAGISVAPFDLGGESSNVDSDLALATAVQPDGKIVVAGYVATTSNGYDAAVLRLNADGTPDESFGNVGRATFDFGNHHHDDQFLDVKVDGAGRIWLAGAYQYATGTDTDFLVARLRSDGTRDTDFCNGKGYQTVPFDLDTATTRVRTDGAWQLLLQPDGKIVLVGIASNGAAGGNGADFAVARLLPDCQLDPAFGPDGNGKLHGRFDDAMPLSMVTAAAFGGSGIVLAGAAANLYEGTLIRIGGQFGVAMIRLDAIFTNGFER